MSLKGKQNLADRITEVIKTKLYLQIENVRSRKEELKPGPYVEVFHSYLDSAHSLVDDIISENLIVGSRGIYFITDSLERIEKVLFDKGVQQEEKLTEIAVLVISSEAKHICEVVDKIKASAGNEKIVKDTPELLYYTYYEISHKLLYSEKIDFESEFIKDRNYVFEISQSQIQKEQKQDEYIEKIMDDL